MTSEIHLFLIWERGQPKKIDIIEDIQKYFQIIEIQNIKWDADNYARNLSRFYGTNLRFNSLKAEECGTGIFTVIIVRDNAPLYEKRRTSAGVQKVNARVFDGKELYRRWTGGGHKIHATNNPDETRKDVLLLTGKFYQDYLNATEIWDNQLPEDVIERNLLGSIQWNSLSELFEVLNETTKYVVLRNFDGFPERYYTNEHGDIDLLVDDLQNAKYICNAIAVFREQYRVHFKININGQTVRFDLRSIGDGYYDEQWSKDILKRRQCKNGFYIPSDEDYKFGLLYHALIHKDVIAKDYIAKFYQFGIQEKNYFEELNIFMRAHHYQFIEPNDFSVYFNAKRIGCSISNKRKWFKITFLLQRIKGRILRSCWKAYKTEKTKVLVAVKKILKPIYRKIFRA